MNLTGQIIVSMPSLEDERFYKTVIYICAHSSEGSMGIIINKKIDYDLYPDLLQQLGIDKPLNNKKLFIRYGGPVESGRGFVLHSDDMVRKETLNIDKGVALTSTAEFFDDLSKGKGPKNCILALGYAGWQPGQLESEIMRNSWMSLSVDNSFLFDDEVSRKWSQAYKLIGIDPNSLSFQSGNA
ncbi:MAG TPA: YqgE/AlgH family protein [Pelagibacterales bacterium]|mgnify:FL=1|jgi:putative transcriptional regulator|nr:YqgE/AlgH family protein [Pelagibacterales bacterium]|tara:strand:- start:98 stop:649 length:552 start_codon:yes stop_codon:yes gene_type:complete